MDGNQSQQSPLTKNISLSLPTIWFGVGIFMVLLVIAWGIIAKIELKEIVTVVTFVIITTALWVNIISFYYTYTANIQKIEFDKQLNQKKLEDEKLLQEKKLQEEKLIQERKLEVEKLLHEQKIELDKALLAKDQLLHAVLENGFTSNTTLLEKRIELNTSILQKRLDFEKKLCALNIISDWHSDLELKAAKWRLFMDDFNHKHQKVASVDIAAEIDRQELLREPDQPTIKDVIKPILNYFEKVALAIKFEVADEDILREYFEDIFILYHKNLDTYLVGRRSGRLGAPNAYILYCNICEKWSKKR